MKWYLAGPMSGIPQFNFPAFDEAATALRAQGLSVISPAELDEPAVREEALASLDGIPKGRTQAGGQTWGDFLARDVKIIADEVDGIILMRGWERSKGARLEAFVGLSAQKQFTNLGYGDHGTYGLHRVQSRDVLYLLTDTMEDLL